MKAITASGQTAWICAIVFGLAAFTLAVRYHRLSSAQVIEQSYAAFSEDASADRVAIGVLGSCQDLILWSDVLANQHYYHQTHFFFLMFDEEPEVCLLRSGGADTFIHHTFHEPNTTWTTGRNSLARSIYASEETSNRLYKYWLFSDADVASDLRCGYCKHLSGIRAVACCMDQFIHFLTGPQQFANVALYLFGQVESEGDKHSEFRRHDCADAMFNAIHREAVPVILPYIHDLDEISWWYPQAVVFHLSMGCLKGGTVTLRGFYEETTGSHASYPRGYEQEVASNLVKQHFHQLIPWPIYTSDMFLIEPACLENEIGLSQGRFTNASSYEWHSTLEFRACCAALQSRFAEFTSS